MATVDWLASVSSRSTVGSGTASGTLLRHGERADDLLLASERDGDHRAPAVAAELLDVRIRRLELEILGLRGLARDRRAPDERLAQADPYRREGLVRAPRSVPKQVRSTNSAVDGSNSKIEPPSAPDSSTARVTIVLSTSSRSRLELTAWLTSPSARSSSTERASSRLRCWSSRNSRTFWIAISALRGERRDQPDRPVVERIDRRAPERDHADDAVLGQHRDAEHRAEPAELAGPRAIRYLGSVAASGICTVRFSRPTRPTSDPGPSGIGCAAPGIAGTPRSRRGRPRVGRRRRRTGRRSPRRRRTAGWRDGRPSRTPAATRTPSDRWSRAPGSSRSAARTRRPGLASAAPPVRRAALHPAGRPPRGPNLHLGRGDCSAPGRRLREHTPVRQAAQPVAPDVPDTGPSPATAAAEHGERSDGSVVAIDTVTGQNGNIRVADWPARARCDRWSNVQSPRVGSRHLRVM